MWHLSSERAVPQPIFEDAILEETVERNGLVTLRQCFEALLWLSALHAEVAHHVFLSPANPFTANYVPKGGMWAPAPWQHGHVQKSAKLDAHHLSQKQHLCFFQQRNWTRPWFERWVVAPNVMTTCLIRSPNQEP